MEETRQLNFFDIFSMSLGGAVGAGIFVLLGIGITYTGRSIPLALIAGSAMMFFAYIYQIVMVSMFPLKGGTYSQSALVMSPVMTGISAVFLLIISTSMAVYTTGIISYLVSLVPATAPYSKVLSVSVMTLFFASTIRGSKFVAKLQNIMTVVLLVAIALFIIIGLPQVEVNYVQKDTFFIGGLPGFLTAVSLMSYACMGTTGGVSLAAVTKNPTKTIPLGIIAATLVLGVAYALVGVVAAGVLPVEEVQGQNLTKVAQIIFPKNLYLVFIIGGAMFALATSLLGAIAALRYPISKIAEDGWLPKFFAKQTANGYPWVTQLTFYIIAIIPILFNVSFDQIIALVQAPTMVLNIYRVVVCYTLPKKYPVQWKNSIFNMPLPAYYLMMSVSVLINIVVAYNLFKTMTLPQLISDIVAMAACIALVVFRLKTKAVDLSKLEEAKKEAMSEVEAYSKLTPATEID